MRTLTYIAVFFILLTHVHAQKRYADVSSRVHYPDSGHVYVSPSTDSLSCWMFNHGPDSLYAVDVIYFRVKLSEIILGPFPIKVGKDMAPGDSVFLKQVFEMKYSRAQPSIPVCSEVHVYSNFQARTPLEIEHDSTLGNNRHCIDAAHALNYPTDVAAVSSEAQVTVYPNPSSGIVHIQTAWPLDEIAVYNAVGKQLPIQPHGRDLDFSGEASGLYFVVLETRKGRLVKKVVKR